MDTGALLLSRIQFAFTASLHIIFPAFTIGLAAWLAYLEACSLVCKRPVYGGSSTSGCVSSPSLLGLRQVSK